MAHNANDQLTSLLRPVDELHADPRNARIHDESNLTAIEVSFREHGQQTPIVIDATGKVLAGNGRLEVAKRLGWTEIAAIEFSGEHADAFALADNRTGELAAWNNDILAELLSEIPPDLIDLTGFTLTAMELVLPPPLPPVVPLPDDGEVELSGDKAPFSYYGGKQRLARRIVGMIPTHKTYVEPFFGGGAVLFAKEPSHTEVVNDVHNDIVTFFRALRDEPEELGRLCHLTPAAREEHTRAKTRPEGLSDVEHARRVFVSIGQGFLSKLDDTWNREHGEEWKRRVDRMKVAAERFRGVSIDNRDALSVIAKFDGPETFVYADPPYPGTDQAHYKGYTVEDFRTLVNALDEGKSAFILSCYDQPEVEIPEAWERYEVHAVASGTAFQNTVDDGDRDATRTEVLWRRGARR